MKLPPGHVPGLVSQHKATAFGGFGQKMLEKMGWEKGQGLGKEKDGMKEAIEVKKKEDTLGVGANAPTWKWDWKYWEDAYNTGLQNIKKDGSSKKKRRKQPDSGCSSSDSGSDGSTSTSTSTSSGSSDSDSDSDASSSGSDADSDAAAGKDSSDSDSESDTDSDIERAARIAAAVNRDGTAASASVAELKLAAELAKSSGRGPAGRFGGREGKMARIRQQEAEQAAAMAAKLGIAQPAAAAAAAHGGKGASASSSSEDTAAAVAAGSSKKGQKRNKAADAAGSSEEDTSAAAAGKQKKKPKKRLKGAAETDSEQQQQGAAADAAGEPAVKKARVVVVVDVKGPSTVELFKAFKPTPSSGWWGAKMFASAGLLEGLEQEQKQRQRTTFDEDLQAKVYMAAHDAQRQGKRGIGKRAIKIAGGNWEGNKVTFGEEAAADQQQQQEPAAAANDSAEAAAAAAAGEPKKKKKKKKKSSKQQDSHEQQQQQQVDPQPSSIKEVKQQSKAAKDGGSSSSSKKSKKAKWAKLAVVQLQGCAGGELKWKKLWPQLRAAAKQAGLVESQDAKDQAWQQLQDSSQLQVNGKLVSLAA